MQSPSQVTRLLEAARDGDAAALEALYSEVYTELRRLAQLRLAEERVGHTLQPTALVHEAFLRLVGAPSDYAGTAHFFGSAARAMRQVLVDHARRRGAEKRGGGGERVTLDGLELASDAGSGASLQQLLDIDAALTRLEGRDARKARVVELRFFGGLEMQEIASLLEVSRQTVQQDWEYARAWLQRELSAA
jgi:RNA polymerase sigma factor (TIGR02999 family)